MSCGCCGRKEPDVDGLSLRCSSFGPMSFMCCDECNKVPTEPEWIFEYLYRHVAVGNIEAVRPETKNYRTYKDGNYILLSEWWKWHQVQPEVPEI